MKRSLNVTSKEVKKKKKPEWEETDEDEDSDNSNYQDAPERPKIHRIRKRIQAPIFKGMIGECPEPHLLRAVDWFDSQGIRRDVERHLSDVRKSPVQNPIMCRFERCFSQPETHRKSKRFLWNFALLRKSPL